MRKCDESCLLNGGDCVGMTDAQFKAHLLEDVEHWQEALELAVNANDTEVQKKAEKQIAKIRTALELCSPSEQEGLTETWALLFLYLNILTASVTDRYRSLGYGSFHALTSLLRPNQLEAFREMNEMSMASIVSTHANMSNIFLDGRE